MYYRDIMSTSDNIAEPSFDSVASTTKTASPATTMPAVVTPLDQSSAPKQQAAEFFNVRQVLEAIALHYERSFKSLEFTPSPQMTDGSSVEFVDPKMKVVLATARLRYRNRLVVNNETGEMHVAVALSDLVFGRPSVTMEMQQPQQAAPQPAPVPTRVRQQDGPSVEPVDE